MNLILLKGTKCISIILFVNNIICRTKPNKIHWTVPNMSLTFRIEVSWIFNIKLSGPSWEKIQPLWIVKRSRLLMYHSAIRWVYWVIQVEQPPPTRYKWDDDTDIEGIRDQSMSRLPHQTPPFWPWSRKIWPKQPRPHSLWPEFPNYVQKLLGHFFFMNMIQYSNNSHFVVGNDKKQYCKKVADLYKTKMHHSFWTTFGNSVHSAHCCSSSILCSSYTHVIFTSSNTD